MFNSGKQDPFPYEDFQTLYAEPADKGPVFAGKPHLQPEFRPGNLAVQRSLMEIFDEFTHVISGELKSMNFEEFQQARQSEGKPPY